MKDTYFDQNRLVDETDRRFHATGIERVVGYVQVVPAVVERLAPLVRLGAWSFSERNLQDTEAIADGLGSDDEPRNLRRLTLVVSAVARSERAVWDRECWIAPSARPGMSSRSWTQCQQKVAGCWLH